MIRTSRRHPVLAIVQAGGQGSRMDVLTRERAKPALPFGGHYQLVDFALSSLAHSGITSVWLGVQYQASSLARHVAGGRPWDLDRTEGGLQWLVPEQGAAHSGFSEGNADDLVRRVDDIRAARPEVVLVLSADSVFALDLAEVVEEHRRSGAACTVVTVDVSPEQARAKAAVVVDEDGRITEVAYKSEQPPSTTIAAEIFAYDAGALVTALEALRAEGAEAEGSGLGDFGQTLLPYLVEQGEVRAYPLSGYWRDLGTPSDYLLAHRDLLDGQVDALERAGWPILSRFPELPPARVSPSGEVDDGLLSAGCEVHGTVRRSVLGPGVHVAQDAVVEDSVIFAHGRVEAGARVASAIVDTHCVIGEGAKVGRLRPHRALEDEEVTLLGRECHVGAGVDLPAGTRLEPGTHL
ncbi:glucose-1-phosphate adenylyltransferase family protein [Arsenicicoccus dermatophilus]|uniref:glucose-1-phosphate adenylyltransferase family protein n=1 Tax=Arsenicicoccus dermatophilus TaxID=1076331 RepID=UPI003916FE5E